MAYAYILDAVRTPRGRGKPGKGALSGVHPQELFAQALRGLIERTGLDPLAVDDVIAGCVSQAGEQGANVARNAVLAAGLPVEMSATTVNRFCASGLQAAAMGAAGVASGYQHLVLAGGVESMSRVPMGSDSGGMDGDNAALRRRFFQVPQGISADLIATVEGITRAQVDEMALTSQLRAAAAIEAGRFNRSLLPVRGPDGAVLLGRDELPRPDTTAEGLAKLPLSFEGVGHTPVDGERTLDVIASAQSGGGVPIHHVHTAGNSSGLADGAAAIALASEDFVKAHGLKPRARIRSFGTVGTDPILMLTGPDPAARKALSRAGLDVASVDLWEINEAFAAVVIQSVRALGIDMEKVNPNGGAIALGHPLGATGAILVGTLLDELERRNLAVGVVTMCIGGGQGEAVVVERV